MVKLKREISKAEGEKESIAAVISALEEIKENKFISGSELFSDEFERIIARLKDQTFRLAVVGEFSSGKSTFLNALIGKDILKHGAMETTATVTEIQNDVSQQDGNVLLDVYGVGGEIMKDVSSDEISEYTSTASQRHSVAQEIEKVVIKSKVLESNAAVCFVDTPGLNGIADKHREKTVEQIKNAHACIYLMQVRGLGQSDIEFLRYICKYQHNIIFVQNFIDELKELEGETPEEKLCEQKKIIEEKVLDTVDDVKYQLVAISARKALISRSDAFDSYNNEELTEELRETLFRESRFGDVLDVISNLMSDNERDKIQQHDAVLVALNLLNQLKSVVTFENTKEREEWNRSVEGIKSKNYEDLVNLLKENQQIYQKRLDDYVESETSDIRKECMRNVLQGIETVEAVLKNRVESIPEIEELEEYVKKNMPNDLQLNVSDIVDKVNDQLYIRFENLIGNAILRMKQYIGYIAAEEENSQFNVKKGGQSVKLDFTQEEEDIAQLEEDISNKEVADKEEEKRGQAIKSQMEILSDEICANNSRISKSRTLRDSEIRQLGSMPEKEEKYRSETYYEYRGGWGIADWLFGPKKRTRSVQYYDDTKQQQWKKKKSDIETKYRIQENQMSAQSKLLEEKRRQCDEDLKHILETESSRKREIEAMRSLLKTKIESLKVQKEKAKQEYLREAKRNLLESARQYLQDIGDRLRDNFEIAIVDNKRQVEKKVKSLFQISYNERIKNLKGMIDENNGFKGYEGTDDLLEMIEQSRKKLEEYLCQQYQ